MDRERALETQRDALLRLLAGWLAFFEFVSGGPIALPLPRWARAFFDALLIRAELAAHYLLSASAALQAKRGGLVFRGCGPERFCDFEGRIAETDGCDDVPSSEDLRERMIALRGLLKNLHRVAGRLLRKRTGNRMMRTRKAARSVQWTREAKRPRQSLAAKRGWIAPRIERPPDKVLRAI